MRLIPKLDPALVAPSVAIPTPPKVGKPFRTRAISSTGMAQALVTGTANTELVAARTGSRINMRWLQVNCRNATAVIVTIFEGQIARWTIQLNATLGWWFEMPIPPADPARGDLGGVKLQTPGNLNFTGDTAGASLDCMALYNYVAVDTDSGEAGADA